MIWSEFLRDTLALTEDYEINLSSLLLQYNFLNQTLTLLELAVPTSSSVPHENAKCLRLLTKHFLVDRKLFNGFNLESLYDQGIISADHWQDMQHLSTLNDLRVIDDAFQKHCYSKAEETNDSDEDSDATNLPSQNNYGYRRPTIEDTQHFHRIESLSGIEDTSLLVARRSTDYQDMRKVRTLIDKLACINDYSDDDDPMDFGKFFIWELHRRCFDWQERAFLARLCESDPDPEICREITSIYFNLSSTDLSSLEDYGIMFVNKTDIPFPTIPMRSIRRLYEQEKKEILTARLHSAFRQEDSRFRHELRQIKQDRQAAGHQKVTPTVMRECEFSHQRYQKSWNTGIAVIRRLFRGVLPRNLEQITRLLQVAYAMGLQDPTNPDFRAGFEAFSIPRRQFVLA